MKITYKQLEKAGFTPIYPDYASELWKRDVWKRDGIEIWEYISPKEKCWLIDALDQAGIIVEFYTMEQLNEFWLACRLPPIIPTTYKHVY